MHIDPRGTWRPPAYLPQHWEVGQQPPGAPALERAHSGSSERLQEAGKLLKKEEEGNSVKYITLEVKSEFMLECATRSISVFIVLLQKAGNVPVAQSNDDSVQRCKSGTYHTNRWLTHHTRTFPFRPWCLQLELFFIYYLTAPESRELNVKGFNNTPQDPRWSSRAECEGGQVPWLRELGWRGTSPPIFFFSNSSWYLIWNKKRSTDEKTLPCAAHFPSARGLPPSSAAERWGVLPEEKRLRKQLDA